MSTKTTEHNQSGISIPLSEIAVEDGHNPRHEFDEAQLTELVGSIKIHGVVQAITVRPGPEGSGYLVVAGHRRLEAARRAGLEQIPALVRTGDGALAAAIAENLIREDLDPVEEAEAMDRLGQAEDLNRKALAARVGKSASYVGDRLRLLKLPEGCRPHFASGALTLVAERPLRAIAKVSEEVAVASADYAAAKGRGDELVAEPSTLLYGLAGAIAAGEVTEPPTLLNLSYGQLSLGLVEDEEERAELIERYEAVCKRLGREPYGYGEDTGQPPDVRISEEGIDAARAAGVLLELEPVDEDGWRRSYSFLVDCEFAADLVRREVEAHEELAEQRVADAAERAAERGEQPPADPGDEDAVAAERRREREERERKRLRAAKHNDKIGVALLRARSAAARKKHSLDRAKALARVVLCSEPNLAARGLRYALPQLRELEVKTLKSGERREKLVLTDPIECAAYLERKVEAAGSANEVLELMAEAMLAAEAVDQREVPQSQRVQFWDPGIRDGFDNQLAAERKEVKLKRPASD